MFTLFVYVSFVLGFDYFGVSFVGWLVGVFNLFVCLFFLCFKFILSSTIQIQLMFLIKIVDLQF